MTKGGTCPGTERIAEAVTIGKRVKKIQDLNPLAQSFGLPEVDQMIRTFSFRTAHGYRGAVTGIAATSVTEGDVVGSEALRVLLTSGGQIYPNAYYILEGSTIERIEA